MDAPKNPGAGVPSGRRSWRRLAADILLLPLAVILEFLERIIWNGAKALLDLISRLPVVGRMRRYLQSLPPLVIVFLFLIPEAMDHLSGFWATALFVAHHYITAIFVAIFVKGFAILLALWIYQSCEASLMSVRWFAWLHDKVVAAKNWVLERTRPIRERLHLVARQGETSYFARRLAGWRRWIANATGRLRP